MSLELPAAQPGPITHMRIPSTPALLRCAPALLACFTLLAGCTTLPTEESIERQAAQAPDPAIPPPDDAALKRAVGGDDIGFIREAVKLEASIAHTPLVAGNKVTLLKDGPATHEAQLEAIAHARHSVHLAIYMFTDNELGQRYVTALSARARAGVKVRIIIDGLGAMDSVDHLRQELKDAGVEVREFNAVSPLKDVRLWRVTHRNHRKLLVTDGRAAFTGGINITDDYLASPKGSGQGSGSGSSGGSFPSNGSKGGRPKAGWRDTQVRIEGPAVAQFQQLFLNYWKELGEPVPDDAKLMPQQPPRDDQFVRVVADRGEDLVDNVTAPVRMLTDFRGRHRTDMAPIYATYLSAIHAARERVWITQAYFAPNEDFIKELSQAAARGVDVRLLMPGGGDVKTMMYAAHAWYSRLLKAGLHLYEYQDTTVLHAKTMVIDGVWSTVGSSNLDYRSFIFNDEANAIIIGRDFGRQMEAMFQDDLKSAREITREDWKKRPALDRVKETFAYSFGHLL